jgi:hypothetical protein
MCTWVGLVLPRDADRASIAALSESYKVAHGFSRGQVRWRGKDVLPLEPRSMCFCGTAVGAAGPRPVDTSHHFLEQERRDLEKKGWGAAKIKRSLDEQRKYLRRQQRKYEATLEALDHNLEQMWIPFLRDVVGRGYASRVGIAATWGSFETASLSLGASVPARDLEPQNLATLDEDEVLTVTP